MLFTNQAEKTMEQIFREAISLGTDARKSDTSKRLCFYFDEQVSFIEEGLQKYFLKPDKMPACFVNITKKIINNLAMVYLRDAKRTIEGTDRDTELFQEISESCGLSVKMKTTSRLTKLLKTTLLRPVWRRGKMDLDILTPDILDVVTGSNPEDMISVMVTHYPDGGGKREIEYSFWDEAEFRQLDYRGNLISSEENPYKTLPFVPIWDRCPTSEFWLTGGEDLIVVQESISEKLTDLLFVIRQQGFGVAVAKGLSDPFSPLEIGPASAITLDADPNADFKIVSPNAPIQEIVDAIDRLIKWVCMTNGLSASSVSTDPTEESGISRIVSNRELDELRRDDVTLFRTYEKRLFEKFKVVWNTHNPDRPFSEEAVLQVDFFDPKPFLSPDKQTAVWSQQIEMGVLTPVDVALEKNPDLGTREKALSYLLELQEEQRVLDERQI